MERSGTVKGSGEAPRTNRRPDEGVASVDPSER